MKNYIFSVVVALRGIIYNIYKELYTIVICLYKNKLIITNNIELFDC